MVYRPNTLERAAAVCAAALLASCASGGGVDAGFGQPVQSTPPTVSVSASPASVQLGTTSTLTWSSTDATACVATGGWSGDRAVSGSQSVTPTASATYTLACTGAGGRAERSVTVAVTTTPSGGEPPPPVAGIGACSSAMTGLRTFDVGPGRTYTELTQVPWLSLRAGDVVNIYHRPTAYNTKIAITAQGTAANPVVINGVTDANCNRPVINAAGASTPTDLAAARYFDIYTENLAAVLIYGGAELGWGYKPKFIQIKNLKVTGAHPNNSYTTQVGGTAQYASGATGIYAVVVEDLVVENCELTGNAVGMFVNTKNDSEQETSYRITLRRSSVYDNGVVGSDRRHNLYIQAVRSVYEGNYIGQLIPGGIGSSLKDRSSGTIVRYNYIVGAARAIDLVETEGGRPTVMVDPLYNDAWVYGNVIISDHDSGRESPTNLVHFGGDNQNESVYAYRNGTLYFYHNTVVTRSNDQQAWRMRIFDMPGSRQRVEARDNVFMHYGNSNYQLMNAGGNVDFVGTNWIRTGWQQATEGSVTTVRQLGTLLEGTDPGFRDGPAFDFMPTSGSPLVDAGTAAPSSLASRWIDLQFAFPYGMTNRTVIGTQPDLGAFERP